METLYLLEQATSVHRFQTQLPFLAALAKCSVSAPIPGPISITPIVFDKPSSAKQYLPIHLDQLKNFDPRLFLNEKPCRSKISFVLTGVAISLVIFSSSLSRTFNISSNFSLLIRNISSRFFKPLPFT